MSVECRNSQLYVQLRMISGIVLSLLGIAQFDIFDFHAFLH